MKNFDCVNGQIIGGEYGQCWVTYDGRKQGPTKYPTSEVEADRFCLEIIEDIKSQCGPVFKEIYPQEKWLFHFDGI